MLTKYIVLVPLRMNDGSTVDAKVIIDFEGQLFTFFGGFTNAGIVGGVYKMADGTPSFDRITQYWIVIQESQYELLYSLVADLGQKLGQESMYLETGSTIDFV